MTDRHLTHPPQGVFPPSVQTACRRSLAVIFMTLFAFVTLLASLLLLSPTPVFATKLTGGEEPPAAGLYFKTGKPDQVLEAPLLRSDVEIDIHGLVARVKLRQHFHNPTGSMKALDMNTVKMSVGHGRIIVNNPDGRLNIDHYDLGSRGSVRKKVAPGGEFSPTQIRPS